MPSNDGIMVYKYYEGTPQIINLATEIGRLLGVVDATSTMRWNLYILLQMAMEGWGGCGRP
jgi:hypothetical protein